MKSVTNKEFVWYLIAGLLAFLGLIAIIFGVVGYHMGASGTLNFIQAFEQKINFELRYLGLIFVGAGTVLAVSALLFNAKKADREIEKKVRREQRIAAQSNKTIEVKNAVEVVVEEAKEEPNKA